ncbi:MAG: tetratricopeptide repeat protein [Bryobacteraceae bacterium]
MHLPVRVSLCGLFAVTLWGQSVVTKKADVRGGIVCEGSPRSGPLSVELLAHGHVVSRAAVLADGSFELNGVPVGEYEVRVADARDTPMGRQFVSVQGPVDGLTLRIAAGEADRPASGGVSLHSLLHPPPAAARREFLRASRAAEKGENEEAQRHLRKALEIFPAYAEAHNDLGVRHMQAGAYAAAAAEFQRALQIDPGAARPHANLALAWFAMGRYADAEQAAQKAVAADPGLDAARRVLDLVLGKTGN